jgi:hypothetical protein
METNMTPRTKMKMKTAIAALVGMATLAGASAPIYAGRVIGDVAFCQKDATGAGTCYGTQRGFRNSADPTAQVDFLLTLTGGVAFVAQYGGASFTCSMPSNATTIAFANFFSTTNQWFQISWDASGTCTYNAIWKSSATGSNY